VKRVKEEPGTWFSRKELAGKPGMPGHERNVRKLEKSAGWKVKLLPCNGGKIKKIHISSLPPETRLALMPSILPPSAKDYEETQEIRREELSVLLPRSAEYNRALLYKYEHALSVTEDVVGIQLRNFIATWNEKNPTDKLPSFPRIMDARKTVKEKGWAYLIGGYGTRKGQTKIKPEWLQYYWDLYGDQNQLTKMKCYRQVKGHFCKSQEEFASFPGDEAFSRLVEKRYGKEVIYYARYGQKKWEDKYGDYIERNYENLPAGTCLVSDHAQFDGGEMVGAKARWPWITSWICMKTQKTQYSYLHTEPPNGEHVLLSLYHAILANGVPKYIYVDNGKDYRMLDFTDGRKHRLEVDEKKIRSLCRALGIIPIFARPFNAKAKIIERLHLKIKEEFARHCVGFRGGNIQERPEKLKAEIKRGLLMSHEELKAAYDDFVVNILNKLPNDGRILKGKSPDEAWNEENPTIILPRMESLIMLISRTGKPRMIRRNGIEDSKRGVWYWAEWMVGMKGQKAIVRRPVAESDVVYISTEKDEYIGKAEVRKQIDAIVETDEGQEALSSTLECIGQQRKIIKQKAKVSRTVPLSERMGNDKQHTRLAAPKGFEASPEAEQVTMITHADGAIDQEKKNSRQFVGERPTELWKLEMQREKAFKELKEWDNYYPENEWQVMKQTAARERINKEIDEIDAKIAACRQVAAGGG